MMPPPKRLPPIHTLGGRDPRNGDDTDPPPLPPAVVERLGELLRDFYSNLTTQPIPEHLKHILDRLDQQREADHGG
jgi:hypothetical protein